MDLEALVVVNLSSVLLLLPGLKILAAEASFSALARELREKELKRISLKEARLVPLGLKERKLLVHIGRCRGVRIRRRGLLMRRRRELGNRTWGRDTWGVWGEGCMRRGRVERLLVSRLVNRPVSLISIIALALALDLKEALDCLSERLWCGSNLRVEG